MKTFTDLFQREPQTRAEAHARVNLIGEHTDYNGGYVLPTLLPQATTVLLSSNDSACDVHLFSANMQDDRVQRYTLGDEHARHEWIDYVQGVTWILQRHGYAIRGFDAWLTSSIPFGSGVSSSAALEISMLKALRSAFHLDLGDVDLARLAQQSENEFVGARVGIMDQMAASVGSQETALLLNSATLEFRQVELPHGLQLAVIHSGITHDLREGQYNARRSECEQAAILLHVKFLCELTVDDLPAVEQLPRTLVKRARHVITENARVLKMVEAFQEGNLPLVGRLMNDSHQSLKDDYEVSVPDVDHLVSLARKENRVFGARLTGGGFGGAIVVAAEWGYARSIADNVCAAYAADTGRTPRTLTPV